jgi:hypothetical protein
MRILARLSAEPTYKSDKDAIHVAFGMIRHYIGRLGYHFRAAATLVSCAPRLMDLLHDFDICGVPVRAKSEMPRSDQLTTLEKILIRMLPGNSSDLKLYQQALTYMDSRYQLFHRFQENYDKPNGSACVHAEVQVLEQFYAHNMQYSGGDPYVACSKPACFCCLLYFRHHPGHVVEPISHNKIYLNWRPPDFSTPIGIIGSNHQRDILNAMNQELRREVLQQLHEKTAPRAWHADSVTGITRSAQSEQAEQSAEELDIALVESIEMLVPHERPGAPPASRVERAILFQKIIEEDGDINLTKDTINDDATNSAPQLFHIPLEEFISDSDENGGVQLEY